jgi:hypothetical protein
MSPSMNYISAGWSVVEDKGIGRDVVRFLQVERSGAKLDIHEIGVSLFCEPEDSEGALNRGMCSGIDHEEEPPGDVHDGTIIEIAPKLSDAELPRDVLTSRWLTVSPYCPTGAAERWLVEGPFFGGRSHVRRPHLRMLRILSTIGLVTAALVGIGSSTPAGASPSTLVTQTPAQEATRLDRVLSPAAVAAQPYGLAPIRNRATNYCLDDSLDFGLRTYPCNGGTWQQWTHWTVVPPGWIRAGSKIWNLMNWGTWLCLDDSLDFGLRTYPCNGGTWQMWDPIYSIVGVTFRNIGTGRCLDDSFGFGLRTHECNQLQWQDWVIWWSLTSRSEPSLSSDGEAVPGLPGSTAPRTISRR